MTAINARIVPKKSSTAGEAPVAGDLVIAELAINTADGKIYTKHSDNSVVEIGGGGSAATYTVNNNGNLAYRFSGPGFDGTEDNPLIYVQRGRKYTFENYLGAHPFQLQVDTGIGGTVYTDGVLGNQPISNGAIVWTVPMDAPEEIYYQCTSHDEMNGIIRVVGAGGAEILGDLDDVKGIDNYYEGFSNGYVNSTTLTTNDGYWSVTTDGTGFLLSNTQDSDFNLQIPESIKFEVVGTTYSHETTVSSVTRFFNTNADVFDVADAFPENWRPGAGSQIPVGSTIRITAASFPAQALVAFDGQILVWSDTESLWVPEFPSTAPILSVNGQTGAVSLGVDDLNDVTLTSLTDQDALLWNSSNSAWENTALATVATTGSYNDLLDLPTSGVVSSINTQTGDVVLGLGDLDDVTLTSLTDGDYIRWNSTNSEWENVSLATVAESGDYNDLANLPTIPASIDDLSDVDTSTVAPTNGGLLVWNNTNSEWEPVTYTRVVGGSFGSGL